MDSCAPVGAMGLDCAKREAKFRADLLVEQPGDHQAEDLELSWRELRRPRGAAANSDAYRPYWPKVPYRWLSRIDTLCFGQGISCPSSGLSTIGRQIPRIHMNLIVKLNMVPIFFLPLIEGWTGTQEESRVA